MRVFHVTTFMMTLLFICGGFFVQNLDSGVGATTVTWLIASKFLVHTMLLLGVTTMNHD